MKQLVEHWPLTLIALWFIFGVLLGKKLGQREALRVIDIVLCNVTSGAVSKLRRRIRGQTDDSELIRELCQEAAFRVQEREEARAREKAMREEARAREKAMREEEKKP